MDIKSIKKLAEGYSSQDLLKMADQLEQGQEVPIRTQDDPGDQLSDYLQAAEVKQLMELHQYDLNTAVSEFSKRVRSVLS